MLLQLLEVEQSDTGSVPSVAAGVLRGSLPPPSEESPSETSFPAGGPGCGQRGFSESSECLSEQGMAVGNATSSLFLSLFSTPVTPSFHQDEDYWVRKILSGSTKYYDFKLRSKPRIFLVSLFYHRCLMYILMAVELELL